MWMLTNLELGVNRIAISDGIYFSRKRLSYFDWAGGGGGTQLLTA